MAAEAEAAKQSRTEAAALGGSPRAAQAAAAAGLRLAGRMAEAAPLPQTAEAAPVPQEVEMVAGAELHIDTSLLRISERGAITVTVTEQ